MRVKRHSMKRLVQTWENLKMNDMLSAIQITISIVYHFINGYFTHWLARDLNMKKINRMAFSLSMGFRVALDHHLFTIYRFRLITMVVDYLCYCYLLHKTKILTVLELGRRHDQTHYDIQMKDGIKYFNCTALKTQEEAPSWDIYAQELENKDAYFATMRNFHASPIPKKFKATFVVPKRNPNCRRWLLYIPGGAFICHSFFFIPNLQRTFPDFGIAVVEYGCVPESCWPSPLIDALDSYKYLLGVLGVNPQNIALISDSAGGNVSLGFLQKLKEYQITPPSCAVFVSPWTDLTCSGESFKNTVDNLDYLHEDLDIDILLKGYSNTKYLEREFLKKSEFSPVFGDLQGLPPILINSGSCEALLDDNKQFYDRLRESGNNSIQHTIYEKMPHIFQAFPFQESKISLLEISDFVNKYVV